MTPRQSTLLLRVAKMLDGYVPGSLPGNDRNEDRMSETSRFDDHVRISQKTYDAMNEALCYAKQELYGAINDKSIEPHRRYWLDLAYQKACDAIKKAEEGTTNG